MTSLRSLDDRLLSDVNGLARSTPWLHGVVLGYATYGVVLFAVVLLIGVLGSRAGANRRLAAAGWACLATALVMAFARVYIAAHYPWDVVAGMLLGAAVSSLGWGLLHGLLTSVTGWLRRLPGVRQAFPASASCLEPMVRPGARAA